jgi:CysZ protein
LLKDYISATAAYGKAHALIKERKLWTWVLVPGLVFFLLFAGGFYLFITTVGEVVNERVLETTGIRQWLDNNDSGFIHFIFSFTGIVVWMVGSLFYFSLFKYVWLIVCSPFLAMLSGKARMWIGVEGEKAPEEKIFLAVVRSIQVALINLIWQTVYFIAFFLVALIPVVGWVVPFFALLMEAYYIGFSMLDFELRLRNLNPGVSRRFIANRKGLAVGNGVVFYAMLLIPVIGWLMAPAYAMLAAAIAVKETENE